MPTCPLCKSEAYVCDAEHTDGPGSRLHCRSASLHNFPWPPAVDNEQEQDGAPCCPDPECTGRNGGTCTFPGYADNH